MPPKKRSSRSTASKAPRALEASMRIVVLHGKEDLLIRQHTDQLRAALSAVHGEVDSFTFDGEAASVADVFDELRSYSLMASHKLVVVDAADQFLKHHREAVTRYAQQPLEQATLLLRAQSWNRGKVDKLIEQHGAILKCDPLGGPAATTWLIDRVKSVHGATITRPAAALLVERVGTGLLALDAEAARLALMVEAGAGINEKLVREVVGRGSDEAAWAVQQALLEAMGRGSAGEAVRAVSEMVDVAGQPDILVLYFTADLMRKLAVADAMRAAGEGESAIASHLKLWRGQQVFFEVLRRLEQGRALELFRGALEADGRGKSGFGTTRRNLECFAAAMTDN